MKSMAAALAKVLRGGRSGSSSHLLPAIGRHVPQQNEGALIKRMSERFKHVNGHFEPRESEIILLHMNESLSKMEKYLRTARRHWMYPVHPVLTLFGPVLIIASVATDYYRLNKIEEDQHHLLCEIAEVQVACEGMDIALHGL
ncbi:hypothetical protein C2845_PM05G14620 [Panicum miliaceum]|uniref:Uncharacterized protein n=1 Tax=Panicum miliaceum TaxID=4540 RepID=A0A3L6SWR1_PANMI|nr:hypothetical protein C2845_PM05G14620 [Panicum miliaceum]